MTREQEDRYLAPHARKIAELWRELAPKGNGHNANLGTCLPDPLRHALNVLEAFTRPAEHVDLPATTGEAGAIAQAAAKYAGVSTGVNGHYDHRPYDDAAVRRDEDRARRC